MRSIRNKRNFWDVHHKFSPSIPWNLCEWVSFCIRLVVTELVTGSESHWQLCYIVPQEWAQGANCSSLFLKLAQVTETFLVFLHKLSSSWGFCSMWVGRKCLLPANPCMNSRDSAASLDRHVTQMQQSERVAWCSEGLAKGRQMIILCCLNS